MSEPFALIFPGQGSQQVGMLSQLAKDHALVKKTFYEAAEVLGYDLWELTQEGPREKLDQTEFTQPALFVADVATFRCWEALGGEQPQFMAGHSLGEYAALVCAKALSFEEGLILVKNRALYMSQAVLPGEGAMGAIIGLSQEQIEILCKKAEEGKVVRPANLNSIGQIVVSGHVEAVERVLALAKAEGARMAIRIPVSVPSHCPLMKPAAESLAQDLEKVFFSAPIVPVIHNVDVASHYQPEFIRQALVDQLTEPVRWVETIQEMSRRGVKTFLECGPDNKLAGLNKRIDGDIETLSLGTTESILSAIQHLSVKEKVM